MQAATTKMGFSTCGVLSPGAAGAGISSPVIGARSARALPRPSDRQSASRRCHASADARPSGVARKCSSGTCRNAPRASASTSLPSVELRVGVQPPAALARQPRADEQLGVDRHRPPVADEDPRRHGGKAVPGREQAARLVERGRDEPAVHEARARPGGARRTGTTPRTRAALPPPGCGNRMPAGRVAAAPARGIVVRRDHSLLVPHVLERPEAELLLVEEAGVVDAAHVRRRGARRRTRCSPPPTPSGRSRDSGRAARRRGGAPCRCSRGRYGRTAPSRRRCRTPVRTPRRRAPRS